MDTRHIAVVVQGLFEKSDSIGSDAVFEYSILTEIFGRARVRLFAERFDATRYPDVLIEPMESFWDYVEANPAATVIYHFCDGWDLLDNHILSSKRQFIVRWHNNTPPWFYGANHRRSVERTIKGFRTIVDFSRRENVQFWVNSNFTLEQFRALGGKIERSAVVFPGSEFLKAGNKRHKSSGQKLDLVVPASERPLRLLFVSRVVAHKGHRHVIGLASYLQKALNRDVSVTFIGRDDPASGFKSDLEHLGLLHDVEVLLTGEVSADELRDAYLAADVFVCFSEHEGFGMPVFEAMRLGVPVLCWGHTALRELMGQHPFTLDDLDFARSAAAIQLLEDKTVLEQLSAIQSDILDTYTAQVIASQLTAAMGDRTGPWPLPEITQPEIAQSISAKLDAAVAEMNLPAFEPDAMRDFGANYVTLYDIESYEALLEADRGLHHLPDRKLTTDHVLLSHREFLSPGNKQVTEGIAFSGLRAPNDKVHTVYGPYARFVRGYFSADFELEAEASRDRETELELDVLAEGEGVLASRRVTAADIRNGTPTLLFPVDREGKILEFRIKITRRGNCNFLFKGVTIRNMRQSIAALPEAQGPDKRAPQWLKRRRTSRNEASFISPRARQHFLLGDEMRDRAWWNDAATAYAEGLAIEPRAFPYLVQMGNCLKEAMRFKESEDTYQRALALRPDDRDANLQLGRLYKLSGNQEAAYHHLLLAARFDGTAAQAMHELAATGFDISSLPDFFGD